MRKLIPTKLVPAMALLVLIVNPAVAQTGGRAAPGGSSSTNAGSQAPWSAPVGHRQPRIDEVPSEKNLSNPNNGEDAALDRKIKSICRGC
jgi:hypothetical protein